MFAGFSRDACSVLAEAEAEALELGFDYVGTEHVLVGLLRQGEGLGATVLKSVGFPLADVQPRSRRLGRAAQDRDARDVPRQGPTVVAAVTPLRLWTSPRLIEALEGALREALVLGSALVETEHLLLGLMRQDDSVALRVLRELDAELPRDQPNRAGRQVELEIRNAVIVRLPVG